jgi:hypothetical protein
MRFFSACLLSCVLASPVAAQVGHDPDRSPYRDITKSKTITVLYSDIAGDGGKVGVGPHNGHAVGVRAELRLSGPVTFGLTFAKGTLERFVVSAEDSVDNRVDGPVDQKMTFIEGSLQFNVTGRKTWHRLAPFVGMSLGYVHGEDLKQSVAQDSSGYRFGGKIFLTPSIGVNLHLSNTIAVRLEGRQMFWKLNYPLAYVQEPAAEPSNDENSTNAVLPDGKRDQWSGARDLRAGLSISF